MDYESVRNNKNTLQSAKEVQLSKFKFAHLILELVPVSFGSEEESGQTVEVCVKEILLHGLSDRENVLASVIDKYPNMIVVDYTVPSAVNDNAELYCKVGVPFVMGSTGGDRDKLYKTVENSKVVAFLAAIEIMAEQFPGAFSGVLESHQTSKVDTSGTAKANAIVQADLIQMIWDFKQQIEMVGVLEERLAGHAFHMYHLTSPDPTKRTNKHPSLFLFFLLARVSFEFQHHVCGRSIYAEGTIGAVIFLSKKEDWQKQEGGTLSGQIVSMTSSPQISSGPSSMELVPLANKPVLEKKATMKTITKLVEKLAAMKSIWLTKMMMRKINSWVLKYISKARWNDELGMAEVVEKEGKVVDNNSNYSEQQDVLLN
ncbi:hypothetical protein Pint_05356 [Pistacia integerrima]|uniref:Uncharacterized protein n=1 Tax=Pistacia integerrima TaxID=434235 RepID=A0ACC0Z5W2_9ROSI|nr:hypothetical protein Pint_05356 [Pistacia integerrima]